VDDDRLPPSEVARDRRRDRLARAHERALMRPGSAKVFKQILDVQEERAQEAARGRDEARGRNQPRRRTTRDGGEPEQDSGA
jgi:hypothetical protein